ncbi:MAG: iron-sulfur cluster biosynthesis family protein [Lentisphaerae bacterium]|nr:iron-sulfur cluster biosynthesis family protein [Lentisphaerota bacterium]
MTISPAAHAKLSALLKKSGREMIGYRFDGAIGNCRGSVPLLKPVAVAPAAFLTVVVDGIAFFIPEEYRDVFASAALDYDERLFNRGLKLSWPHREGGCPNCR